MERGLSRAGRILVRNLRTESFGRLLLAAIVCAPMLGGMTGCAAVRRFFHPPPPCALQPGASYSQIVGKVNQNFAPPAGPPLAAWECIDVNVSMNGMPAVATVSVQAPHRLRIRVTGMISGTNYVDLGSNAEEVWYWDQWGPGVIRASHEELPLFLNQVQIPLDPEWLMEVLGVIPIDPDQYDMRQSTPESKHVDLVADRSAPSGEPVRHMIRVDRCYGHIIEHRIETVDGTLLARAVLDEYQQDASHRYTLPHTIHLELPQAGSRPETQITFRLRNIRTEANRLANLDWSVPQINGYAQLRVGEPHARHTGEPRGILTGSTQGASRARITLPVLTVDAPPERYSEGASQSSSDQRHQVRESEPRRFP
jgi:hypothetical protein